MSKITHVFIVCHQGDLHLARMCVASIRFWYPDLPIYLVKDESRKSFSTVEMEKAWNVTAYRQAKKTSGMYTKFEPFFAPIEGRALYLDADIVLIGRILETLEKRHEDILISAESWPDPRDPYVLVHFYDWDKLHAADPDFEYPGVGYNAGQFVWTAGKITAADFDPILEWEPRVRLKRPDMLHCGDQGAANYVVHKKQQAGHLTIGHVDFARWSDDPAVDQFRLEQIAEKEGYPFLVHWASPAPKFFYGKLRRSDLLYFFEDYYYSRVPFGGIRRALRKVARVPGAIRRQIQEWRNQFALGQRMRRLLSLAPRQAGQKA